MKRPVTPKATVKFAFWMPSPRHLLPATLDSEDIGAANEFISLIGSPTVTSAVHLFPFLMRRCGANINKRIHNLHTTIQSTELRSDFSSALQTYVPEANILVEFPVA